MATLKARPQALTGHVQGSTRKQLINRATQEAATYYRTTCVGITLTYEQAKTDYIDDTQFDGTLATTAAPVTYIADYEATETHTKNSDAEKYANRINGKPNTCDMCGKEYQ